MVKLKNKVFYVNRTSIQTSYFASARKTFVCSSTKTEVFRDRLNESIEQIRKHIHEEYYQSYQVSLERIITEIDSLDTFLKEAPRRC